MKRINIKRIKLTPSEKAIEKAVINGEYLPVSPERFE